MNDKIPCISVIVPVYKVEAYLSKCIDSILAQSFTDFELLLIDDGSPDNSGIICDQYAKKDERVKVFHKSNGGVSSARNHGLDNAKGVWVAFVDSDDYVGEDYLKGLYEIVKSDIDLVIQTLYYIKKNGTKISYDLQMSEEKKVYTQSEFRQLQLDLHLEIRCQPFSKLFKRSIIKMNNINFPEDIHLGEDYCFLLKYLCSTRNKVCVSSMSNYFYIDKENSLIHSKKAFLENYKLYQYVRNVTTEYIQKYNCQIEDFDIAYFLHRAITVVRSKMDLRKISSEDWNFFCTYFKVISWKTALDKWVVVHFHSYHTFLFLYFYLIRSFREVLEKRNLWSIVDFLRK